MVTDFGTITTNSERTRRNTMCGTILYLAPEVHGVLILKIRQFTVNLLHLQLIYGPQAVCFIFSSLVVSFSKEKTSFCFFSNSISRLNVIESIDHFCVDLLEFPDYVPEDARVQFPCFFNEQDLIRHMLDISPSSRITAKQAMALSFLFFLLIGASLF